MYEILIIHADKCTGCRVCELVCSMSKSGEYNPAKAYITVLRNRDLDVNIPAISESCDCCGKCVAWCSPQALQFVSPEEAAIIRKNNLIGSFPAPIVKSINK
jgi:anaerobic carbon-monoxide dehydrogenase iron sulfur subunit